ncbi:hypothetical protein I6F11_22250 [Ensifer sp. NBAIM29]|nr:hypothetical protein [Ensifer sp. NBAIM29]
MAAKLRRSNIDASAYAAQEVERIVSGSALAHGPHHPAGDAGFARDELMAWCGTNDVDGSQPG